MKKDHLIYIDGQLVPSDQATVSVFDHGLLYGDGVFEGIRAYEGVVFQLEAHLNRLYRSAKAIWLNIPLKKEAMREAVLETLRRNKLEDAYIRLLVTRGKGDLSLNPDSCPDPSVIIIAQPVSPVHGQRAKNQGIRVILATTRRNATDAATHEIKSLNYLNNIMGKLEATRQGADDAILLDSRGFVAEATATTLFAAYNGKIQTPPLNASLLDSITRCFVIDVARELGYPVIEADLTVFRLHNAEEVFLCGTLCEMVPVVNIDDQRIGAGKPGPIFKQIYEAFIKKRKDSRYGTQIRKKREILIPRVL